MNGKRKGFWIKLQDKTHNFSYFYSMIHRLQHQAKKILSCYIGNSDTNDIIKGKAAEIGEIHEWNGKKVVKHADGWVYLTKTKGHKLYNKEGKVVPASQEHIDHHSMTLTNADIKNQVNKDIPGPPKKVRKTLSANFAVKSDAEKYKSLTKHILEATKPVVNEILSRMRDQYEQVGQEFKNDERQLQKIGVTYELLSTITSYLNENDKIVDYDIDTTGNRITADFLVERDGKEHHFSTQVIQAGGWNVQQLHTRYIVDSDFKKKDTNIFTQKDLTPEQREQNNYINSMYSAIQKINKGKKEINKLYQQAIDLIDVADEIEENPPRNMNQLLSLLKSEDLKPIVRGSNIIPISHDILSKENRLQKYIKEYASTPNKEKRKKLEEQEKDFNLTDEQIQTTVKNILNSIQYRQQTIPKDIKDVESENRKTILTSPLPDTVYMDITPAMWDKYKKEFKFRYGGPLNSKNEVKVPKKDINWVNKSIVLTNPSTGGSETFYYDKEESKGKLNPVFKSKRGLVIR